jgi:hypothetical protein
LSVLTGILALATGVAYTALGVIATYELIRHRRDRGFSHFGLSFAVMAFTCGPHHLVHAYRHLIGREPAHGPMLAAMAIGAVPAVVFISLRLEAAFGGRGDRLVRSSHLSGMLPWLMLGASSATLWESLHHAANMAIDLRALVPNIVLFVNYCLVGYFTARTQLARRPLLDGWSLSGTAMSAVFGTCALSHLVAGLLTGSNPAGVAFDNVGVPSSIYFLWAVYRLNKDSERDWNRRPLVGRAAPLGRRSPWAEANS